jgi:hypothetical protein
LKLFANANKSFWDGYHSKIGFEKSPPEKRLKSNESRKAKKFVGDIVIIRIFAAGKF